MLVLLSCAKTMSDKSKIKPPFVTSPKYQKEALLMAKTMSSYSSEELRTILKVNPQIAAKCALLYKIFLSEHQNEGKLPAIIAYSGLVFKKLDPSTFTKDDFLYAQDHLRITSFFYGLLKPLDLISQYRMEGNVELFDSEYKNAFDFWKDKLTDELIEDTKKVGGILCNLASHEMRSLFDWKRVEKELTVFSPEFKTYKDGKLKTIVVYTKIARGETARQIIKERIEDPNILELPEY
ncbi:MAG: YaaA family protein [Bacteroidales bacterium]|nr:YaaA family protein [Bacteroidales bacterium]